MVGQSVRRAVLLSLLVVGLVSAVLQPTQGYAHTFVSRGIVDCGQREGRACPPGAAVYLWTDDLGGGTKRVLIDFTWIASEIDRLDQGDYAEIEIQPQADGRYVALNIVDDGSRNGTFNQGADRPEQPKDIKELEAPPSTATATQTTVPTSTSTPTVSPTATLTLTSAPTSTGTTTATATPTATSTSTATATSTSTATATPTATATQIPRADLRVSLAVDSNPFVFDPVEFTVGVTNDGPDATTGVTVKFLLPPEFSFTSSNPDQGTYDSASGIWDVGALGEPLPSAAVLIVSATAPNSAGSFDLTAELTASSLSDPDSTPNNHVSGEDDQATITVTVQNFP